MNNYFKVLRPGINSTFQDLGRFGLQHLGIVASGCMDQFLFCISNKLVNNEISEGAIEFAYQGPLLQLVGKSALIAVSGKVNFNIIKKNGDIIKGIANESFTVSDGDKSDILSTINSVYGYLSIKGGFKLRKLKDKPVKLEELSKKFNISRERVRQIEEKALEKLQKQVSLISQ